MDEIRKIIKEVVDMEMDEERIPNTEADEYVVDKENFVGSHVYGEDLGELGKMYVAYSYGEQHPLYVWVDKKELKDLRAHDPSVAITETDEGRGVHFYDEEISKNQNQESPGVWFYNETPYYVKDRKGKLKPNRWTYKHLEDLKPNEKVQARHATYLLKLIRDFKNKYKIGENNHSNLKPGEK